MGWQGFNRADDPQAAYDAFAAGSKMKRLPTNDDVVEAFAFLASDRASFMTGAHCRSTAASLRAHEIERPLPRSGVRRVMVGTGKRPIRSSQRWLPLVIETVDRTLITSQHSKVASMNTTSAQCLGDESRPGTFHYLDATARPSLYRNGAVLTRRDPDGSDGGTEGVYLEEREITVHNARLMTGDKHPTVARNGFDLLTRPLARGGIDFFDQHQVVREYYIQCARIVQESTGGQVFAFDHNIRSASGKSNRRRISGGQQVQGPAHVAHGDYTLTGAPQRLRDLTKPATGNDTLCAILDEGQALIAPEMAQGALDGSGRFVIINVWRNIAEEPVATHPMALADGQSVEPEDLVVFEIHYRDRIGENYFCKHSPRHRWYFYPDMTSDEALLIKQWDSAGALARSGGAEGDASDRQAPCTFSLHSAFEDRSAPPDAPDRWSIEVRCMVLFD
jgi:hypothetical protein